MIWFLECLEKSIDNAHFVVEKILKKHSFWSVNKSVVFNPRQIKVLNLLLGNFYGILTTSKWAQINKCSHDTALRDIKDLVHKSIFRKSDASGRSTNYVLLDKFIWNVNPRGTTLHGFKKDLTGRSAFYVSHLKVQRRKFKVRSGTVWYLDWMSMMKLLKWSNAILVVTKD